VDTEIIATTAVKERLALCDGLQSFINERDKEPLWDGHIYVFQKDNNKKENLIGRVSVQVKGKEKDVSKETTNINYEIEVTSLKKYLQDGGLIYFVVVFSENGEKNLFYKILLPFDIQQILKDAEGKKKRSIKMHKLPEDNDSIRHLFIKFIQDKKRQATQIVFSEEQMVAAIRNGGSLKFHVLPKVKPRNSFDMLRETTTQDIYLYVETKDGVEIPFSKIEQSFFSMAIEKKDIPVCVNGIKYYDSISYGYENEKAYIYIGQAVKIPFIEGEKPRKQTTKFKLKGTLKNRIVDSDFLIALAENKIICFGEKILLNISIDNYEEVENLKEINETLKKLKSALDYFGVSTDLDMDNLSAEDNMAIDDIIRASSGKPLSFNEKDLPHIFYSVKKIGNISIRILVKKEKYIEGYVLSSAFSDEIHVTLEFVNNEGNKVIINPWSLFVDMTAQDFLYSNVDYSIILKSIQSLDTLGKEVEISDPETGKSISTTVMLLEIISAYDSQSIKDHKLLQFALDIAETIKSDSPVTIINKFQVIRRMRDLTPDEIADLVGLRRKFKDNILIKCGISIILGEYDDAKKLLNELPEEERKRILDYPLYKLIPRR